MKDKMLNIIQNAPYMATHYTEYKGKIAYYVYVDGVLCYIRNGFELYPDSSDYALKNIKELWEE